MYIYTPTEGDIVYPYHPSQLLSDNPQVSFPVNLTDEVLASWNVFPVEPTKRPVTDHTKNITEAKPKFIRGKWRQVWDVTPSTEEEIKQRTVDKASEIRSQRNELLKQTDWTQLSDVPEEVPKKWLEYRTKLRNISTQPGFPWSIEWPTTP